MSKSKKAPMAPRAPDAEQERLGPVISYREIDLDFDRSMYLDPGTARDSIPISISSETPVERFDFWDDQNYLEVLDHGTNSVDLGLAGRGLPFLDGHDTRAQMGLVENVRLDADRVLRGEVRFSQRAEAQALRQDMIDGIRTKISVGYRIDPKYVSKTAAAEGTPQIVRISRWTPMEASSVAIPADHSVGVGRAADLPRLSTIRSEDPGVVDATSATATKAEERIMETPVAPAPVAAPTATITRADEQQDGAKIASLAREFGFEHKLVDWITGGMTLEQARHEVMQGLRAKTEEQAKSAAAPVIQLTDKERKRYNMGRAILSAADAVEGKRAGSFELEVSQELSKIASDKGLSTKGGLLVPYATDVESVRQHNMANGRNQHYRAGLDSVTATKGQELKFTVPGDFLPILRNFMTTYKSGIDYLSGLQGPVAFPEQNGAGTAAWYSAENPGSDIAASNLLLTQISLTPKTLGSYTSYSRQLLAQAVVDVDGMVRADLAAIIAIELDRAVLYGSGASGQPSGIGIIAGTTVLALGANGATPTYANLVDMETPVANANGDQWPCCYYVTPITRGTFKKIAPLSNTIATPVWTKYGAPPLTDQVQGMPGSREVGELNGYPAWATANLPETLTKGASGAVCQAIIFGPPSQTVVGDWGMFEIIVDPYKLKAQGMIELAVFSMFGVAIKYPGAYTVVRDALA